MEEEPHVSLKWSFAAAMISFGCAGASGSTATPATLGAPIPAVSTPALDAHLKYLADDLLEGRAPATRGGRLAAKYIAAQFEALGLEPAANDGSYFQPVALVGMTPRPSLVWGKGGATRPLVFLDDFVAWAERPESHIDADGEVVFVGYGIEAKEWRWDDYKDVDVRGKVLLMLVNDPGLQDSTIFNGRALTYYGRWTYKLEEAARRGALGAILLHTTESATYGWDVVRGSWSVEQFKLDRPAAQSIAFAAWVTHDTAQAALARAGLNLDSLTRAAARRVADIQATYVGDQAIYFLGVMNNVHHEYLKQPKLRLIEISDDSDERERIHLCLDNCLERLAPQSRQIIERYYAENKRAKIDLRKRIAREFGISLNTLRLRALRIRARLQTCIKKCLEVSAGCPFGRRLGHKGLRRTGGYVE